MKHNHIDVLYVEIRRRTHAYHTFSLGGNLECYIRNTRSQIKWKLMQIFGPIRAIWLFLSST